MQKQWDRWGWLIALMVIAIFVARMAWGRSAFCGPDDEQCFREWISALAGWGAVAAAVPTILFLSKQISAAERHHRHNLEIGTQQSVAVIRRTLRAAARTRTRCEVIRGTWATVHPRFPPDGAKHLFEEHMREIRRFLRDPVFERFENEIEVPTNYTIAEPLEIIEMFAGLSNVNDTSESVETYQSTVDEVISAVETYCSDIEAAAQRRLERAEAMTGAAET
ncbi:hypothetical protein AB9E28_24855 [Rhizobium leguminosarum]|uniref:hypothetical protein n=1 Tax=Rhizobium leguminosarum TaxID=384 RepID=UPI003F99FD36